MLLRLNTIYREIAKPHILLVVGDCPEFLSAIIMSSSATFPQLRSNRLEFLLLLRILLMNCIKNEVELRNFCFLIF